MKTGLHLTEKKQHHTVKENIHTHGKLEHVHGHKARGYIGRELLGRPPFYLQGPLPP
jgi:hypothetical protein